MYRVFSLFLILGVVSCMAEPPGSGSGKRSPMVGKADGTAGKARKCYTLSPDGVAALQQSRDLYDSLWSGVRLRAGESES